MGGKRLHISNQFIAPKDFGFDTKVMEKNDIGYIVCGHVGIFSEAIRHTEMAHIFKKEDNGTSVITRYWMGEKLQKLFQKRYFHEDQAYKMAKHCRIEFERLGQILPKLYNEFR
jgi:hypothetical protein